MKRSMLKANYIAEDSRRALREPTFRSNTFQIRQRLRNIEPKTIILMDCYNDVEAEIIRESLTPEENNLVSLRWKFTIPPDPPEVIQ